MSESKALGVTIKAPESERYAADNPWLVFEGEGPTIFNNIVQTFGIENPPATLAELVIVAQSLFTATANAVRGLGKSEAPAQQAAPQQPAQQAWGQNQGAQQQNQPPRSKFGGQLHPEGKTCEICPNVLELKKTQTGKSKWQCDAWRWNSGNPNGHSSEFID